MLSLIIYGIPYNKLMSHWSFLASCSEYICLIIDNALNLVRNLCFKCELIFYKNKVFEILSNIFSRIWRGLVELAHDMETFSIFHVITFLLNVHKVANLTRYTEYWCTQPKLLWLVLVQSNWLPTKRCFDLQNLLLFSRFKKLDKII